MNQIKSDVPSRKDLEKLQQFVEESQDSHRGKEGQNYQLQLTSIEKQRREWEEAREKAEAMSQIFDSLIITSKTTQHYRLEFSKIAEEKCPNC